MNIKLQYSILGIFTILILSNLNSYGQDFKTSYELNLLPLIDDVNFPCLQIGIENKIKNNVYLYNEIGMKYRRSIYENNEIKINQNYGYKYKIELRHYLKNIKSKNSNTYYGINLQYSLNSYNSKIEYRINKNDTTFLTDNFGVTKTLIIPNLIIGEKKNIGKHFYLDFYAGIGLRIRNIKNKELEFNTLQNELATSTDFTILSSRNRTETTEGKKILFNLTGGVRLVYRK